MNYKIIDVYCPIVTSDYGSSYILGYFSDADVAKNKSKGKDNWGGNCSVITRQAIKFEDKIFLLDKEYAIDLDGMGSQKIETLKRQAKAKLTQEELEALEIKD